MARLHIHDPTSVELQVDVPFDDGGVDLDVWFFVPSQLGIGEPAFDRVSFYRDRTAYVRFEPPRRELRAAADLLMPVRLEGDRLGCGRAPPEVVADAERALRLFASCVWDQLRERRHRVEACAPAQRGEAVLALVADARAVLAELRALRADLPAPSPAFADSFAAVDDFVSMQCVEVWFRLHERGPHPALAEALIAETAARVERGEHGPLRADDAADNERFVAELNRLKKFVLSALHLRFVSTRRTDAAQDLAFGLAAALAMSVAVTLQLVATWTLGAPTRPGEWATILAFVGFAVLSYILKDRMKDRLKEWFSRRLPRWLYDRRVELCPEDSTRPLGHAEETVRLLHLREVPVPVAACRESGEDRVELAVRTSDDVVHYRRALRLGPALPAQCPEAEGVEQILRFNLASWLGRMDEPSRVLFQLAEDGSARRIRGPKTYRVPVVLSVRRHGGVTLTRQTLVLSREGLVRVEEQPARQAG